MFDLGAVLLISFFIGPVVFLLPIALSKHVRSPDFATLWMLMGTVALFNGGLMAASQRMIADPFNAFYVHWIMPVSSVAFLIVLLVGSYRLGKAGSTFGPWWLRAITFVSLLFFIPMGFGGVAELIDGNRGPDSIIQYAAEYFWRLADMVSFGYVSNFPGGRFDDIVVQTKSGGWSVVLFNLVVGAFALTWSSELLRFAKAALPGPSAKQ